MENKLIKVGSKLICCMGKWVDDKTDEDTIGPEEGETVTIRDIAFYVNSDYLDHPVDYPSVILWFEEYPGSTEDDSFYLDDNFIVAE